MTSSEKNSAGPTSGGGFDEDFQSGLIGRCALQVFVCVLDHDDGGIDHGADGNGNAAKAHDVGAKTNNFIARNAIRMATGSIRIATRALRTWRRNTIQTRATTTLSSNSVRRRVSMAR